MKISDSNLLKLFQLNTYENTSKLAAQLKVGDVFEGQVLNITQNKILLQLLNGAKLEAKLNAQMELKIGELINFKVQSTDSNQMVLKPIYQSDPKTTLIFNALQAAGLSVSKNNIDLVKGLLTNQLPIDKDFMIFVSQQLKNNDTTLSNLLFMLKNNLQVTDNNVQLLNNFVNNTNSLSTQLEEFIIDLTNKLDTIEGEKLIPAFIKGLDIQVIKKSLENINLPILDGNHEQVGTEQLENRITALIGREEPTTSQQSEKPLTHEVLDRVLKALDLPKDLEVSLRKDIIKNQLIKDFFIPINNKEEVMNVNKLYNRLMERLDEAEQLVGHKDTSILSAKIIGDNLGDKIHTMRENIQFLNNLNENMTFAHIPLQFTHSLAGGNLFILNEKEGDGRQSKEKGLKTALLSLDLAYLGHLEAYVGLKGKKISFKIGVENEEIKSLMQAHVIQLKERLQELGYSIESYGMHVIAESFNFIDQHKAEEMDEKRYSFDMRV